MCGGDNGQYIGSGEAREKRVREKETLSHFVLLRPHGCAPSGYARLIDTGFA